MEKNIFKTVHLKKKKVKFANLIPNQPSLNAAPNCRKSYRRTVCFHLKGFCKSVVIYPLVLLLSVLRIRICLCLKNIFVDHFIWGKSGEKVNYNSYSMFFIWSKCFKLSQCVLVSTKHPLWAVYVACTKQYTWTYLFFVEICWLH